MFDLKGKPVLVTGASGFLGGHVVEKLLARGAEVVGLVHDTHKDSYVKFQGLPVDHMVNGDITSLADMTRIIADYEIEYVFHLAADPIVRKCSLDPIGCFETNIMGTAMVLEAARTVGTVKGVLCMESDKSYGSFDAHDLPYREDQALKPSAVYEVSKACAGLVAKAYDSNYDLPTYTIRGANLYGPGDMNLSRLLPGSILRLLGGESPVLYGGVGNYIREFIYVGDAAEIICQLMEKIDLTRGHAINLGSGETFQIGSLMSDICEAVGGGLEPKIVEKQDSFHEIEKQWLDLTKLRSFIPDFEYVKMPDGLRMTVDWYREFNKFRTE
jgi:CDP-glucose 4,6-dehydratase